MPSATESVPSVSVIFWVALCVLKQMLRLAATACSTVAAHGRQLEDDVVAGSDLGDAVAHRYDDAGGLVAEQEREVVVDAALPVVEIDVEQTHTPLDRDNRLARTQCGTAMVSIVTGAPFERAMMPRTC